MALTLATQLGQKVIAVLDIGRFDLNEYDPSLFEMLDSDRDVPLPRHGQADVKQIDTLSEPIPGLTGNR